MHAYRSGSDVRHWCDPNTGTWYGAVIVLHENLCAAHRCVVLEGRHLDVDLPDAVGRVRLWPLAIIDARGIGVGVPGDCRLTVFEAYELTFVYGRRA